MGEKDIRELKALKRLADSLHQEWISDLIDKQIRALQPRQSKDPLTQKFVNGLAPKYRVRVEAVVRECSDCGYLVYLADPWMQDDDDVTTVIGDTMKDARDAVRRTRNVGSWASVLDR